MRSGGDLSGSFGILPGRLDLEGRISVLYYQLDLQPVLQEGVSLGMQAGARYRFADGVMAHLLVEENVNRFFPSSLRVIAMLDLAAGGGAAGAGTLGGGAR
jgi:hypothetical protein